MDFARRDLLSATAAVATLTAAGAAFAQNAPAAPPGRANPPPSNLPDNEKKINIVTLRDLEAQAEKVMAPFGFAYVSGGAGDEWTMRENLAAFNRWVIMPEYLSGHGAPDTSTTIFGTKISYPAITAPVGNQGSVHAQKEAPAVKGTAMADTIYTESSVSQLSLEDVAAASDGPKWFQIYFPADRGFAAEMLQRAKAAGYKVIVITVDAFLTSNRERATRLLGAPVPNLPMGNVPKTPGSAGNAMLQKIDLNWDDVEYCHAQTGLPVVVKSLLSVRQAQEAVRRGCAGVWLSNHGGRQLDNTPSAITMLPKVAAALNGRVPIIVDGGFYRGQDVFRALALGASVVALGRPLMYGSALGGAQGVAAVHQHLKTEFAMTMQLAGTPTVKSITRDYVDHAEAGA
ncbi:MAG TPA: alpha-hydroxy acid oxidase [Xanthobacteraceae bacterium]|nr:alpha-hydroxy acid oxidase [Xanthobacteraceae bacterium]